MNSSAVEFQEPIAQHLTISENSLTVDLIDGRTIIVPLSWYLRLWHGTAEVCHGMNRWSSPPVFFTLPAEIRTYFI
jgi:hypothetical protein